MEYHAGRKKSPERPLLCFFTAAHKSGPYRLWQRLPSQGLPFFSGASRPMHCGVENKAQNRCQHGNRANGKSTLKTKYIRSKKSVYCQSEAVDNGVIGRFDSRRARENSQRRCKSEKLSTYSQHIIQKCIFVFGIFCRCNPHGMCWGKVFRFRFLFQAVRCNPHGMCWGKVQGLLANIQAYWMQSARDVLRQSFLLQRFFHGGFRCNPHGMCWGKVI